MDGIPCKGTDAGPGIVGKLGRRRARPYIRLAIFAAAGSPRQSHRERERDHAVAPSLACAALCARLSVAALAVLAIAIAIAIASGSSEERRRRCLVECLASFFWFSFLSAGRRESVRGL
jgi:hypothetical protein